MRRALAAVSLAILMAAPACKERGRPDPNVRMAISHELAVQPSGAAGSGSGMNAGPGADVPNSVEVPPEVSHMYTGVKIAWKDKSDGKEGVIEVPLGGGTPLPDPSLVVKADVFLPNFTMGGGAITSEGVEPQNPAARVKVFDKGKEIFAGWIFTRFPDVHPFNHPRFQLHLEGGVAKAKK
jgi:Uncharacterized protein conserved in bacteria (DUF2155)